jgi:4-hydroxybutyrate CoA-transferase
LYSGVGGQLDFIYGASRSKEGVPIIALPSTAKDFSRIVGMLKQGAGVVTTRNHVRYIVTEYGIADLYGKTIRQRAHALINIAHPDFRDELTYQARELHYI